jgi:hypothetical protein
MWQMALLGLDQKKKHGHLPLMPKTSFCLLVRFTRLLIHLRVENGRWMETWVLSTIFKIVCKKLFQVADHSLGLPSVGEIQVGMSQNQEL